MSASIFLEKLIFRLPHHVQQILSKLAISQYFWTFYIVHFLLSDLIDPNSKNKNWVRDHP